LENKYEYEIIPDYFFDKKTANEMEAKMVKTQKMRPKPSAEGRCGHPCRLVLEQKTENSFIFVRSLGGVFNLHTCLAKMVPFKPAPQSFVLVLQAFMQQGESGSEVKYGFPIRTSRRGLLTGPQAAIRGLYAQLPRGEGRVSKWAAGLCWVPGEHCNLADSLLRLLEL
jgi:hypothetical protein